MSKIIFTPLGVITGLLTHNYIIDNPILVDSTAANEAIALFGFLVIVSITVIQAIE